MQNPHLARIDGVSLSLRVVQPQDAAYIHALRMDPTYNTHLSTVTGSVQDQADWIRRYKTREAEGTEYYYVIERRVDAQPCGLVRLYDIVGDQFTWGSWILDHNKPSKAALESAVLSFGVGFTCLGSETANVDVRNDNAKARAFYQRLGMTYVRRNEIDTFYTYSAGCYKNALEANMEIIRASAIR